MASTDAFRAPSHEFILDQNEEFPITQYPPAAPVYNEDGTIDYPDGTLEINGYVFDPIDWDELDPPEGSPGAAEISHEEACEVICRKLGLPPGAFP